MSNKQLPIKLQKYHGRSIKRMESLNKFEARQSNECRPEPNKIVESNYFNETRNTVDVANGIIITQKNRAVCDRRFQQTYTINANGLSLNLRKLNLLFPESSKIGNLDNRVRELVVDPIIVLQARLSKVTDSCFKSAYCCILRNKVVFLSTKSYYTPLLVLDYCYNHFNLKAGIEDRRNSIICINDLSNNISYRCEFSEDSQYKQFIHLTGKGASLNKPVSGSFAKASKFEHSSKKLFLNTSSFASIAESCDLILFR